MSVPSNLILAPGLVQSEFALASVFNNLTSLYLIALHRVVSGVDEWVGQVAAALSDEQMQTHCVLFDLLYSAFELDDDVLKQDALDFPTYLEMLAAEEPVAMRDRFMRHMFSGVGEIQYDAVLGDYERFVAEIDRSELDQAVEEELFVQAFALVNEPPALQETITSHLTMMWQDYLQDEWEHNRPLLEQTVAAFEKQCYPRQNALDAVKQVTGRDVRDCWQTLLARAEIVRFIPSPHIGPYLLHASFPPVVRVFFGVRPPERAAQDTIELARADLLVRLRTLADETRLHILELLLAEGELCAQALIDRLSLTKSSASRHLSQLSAMGYLTERSGPGKTKCYALNPTTLQETIAALRWYTGRG